MLENLNRIFGACFPPLVILGWLGAGIFLYTAFRSGEWRKKLTGMEGFLALLLLFMMANRIPNPAIISFRYVIGIGVLTLFWSVWLLRWSWHNCPAPLRRWRGMLLLALTFGICLGGFLKEIRLSKRTRRETEVIRFLKNGLPSSHKQHQVWLTNDDRLERMLISAGVKQYQQVIIADDIQGWKYALTELNSVIDRMFVYFPNNMISTNLFRELMQIIPEKQWDELLCGIHSKILKTDLYSPNFTTQAKLLRDGTEIISENFDNSQKLSKDNIHIQELRKRDSAFAAVDFQLPFNWSPNAWDGYKPGKIQLEVKKDENFGKALFFSGSTAISIMNLTPLEVTTRYRCRFLFRGDRQSSFTVGFYSAITPLNLKVNQLKSFQCAGENYLLYGEVIIPEGNPGELYRLIMFKFLPGKIYLEDFVLSPEPFSLPQNEAIEL